MNAYHSAERFLEIIEKASGEADLFNNNDGTLTAMVSTGRTIATFKLKAEFPHDYVLITTSLYLGVEEQNRDRVRILLESINDLGYNGIFYIDKDNSISFSVRCELDDLTSVDNPFDIVFYGCETFKPFETAILKALSGTCIYYINL